MSDEGVEYVMWISGFPRWVAALLLDLAVLEARTCAGTAVRLY